MLILYYNPHRKFQDNTPSDTYNYCNLTYAMYIYSIQNPIGPFINFVLFERETFTSPSCHNTCLSSVFLFTQVEHRQFRYSYLTRLMDLCVILHRNFIQLNDNNSIIKIVTTSIGLQEES